MPEYPLHTAFHFRVEFLAPDFGENDTRFQTVGGLKMSVDTETLKEGGENRFEHVLPVKSKYANLSLKRGLLTDSNIITWCIQSLENMQIQPVNLVVNLLNESHEPLMTWNIKHAWPITWSISELNAENSTLAIESLEMTYHYFTTSTP